MVLANGVIREIGMQRVRSGGFTLVELIMILVILGIVAVSAAPKLMPKNTAQLATAEAQLIGFLRWEQQRAMQDTLNSKYGINKLNNAIQTAQKDRTLELGVTLTGDNFYFNAQGCVAESADDGAGACAPENVYFNIEEKGFKRCVAVYAQGWIAPTPCEK